MDKNRITVSFKNSESGQLAIEAVLLLVVLTGIFMATIKYLNQNRTIPKMTNSAVGNLKNMTRQGTWKETCKALKGGNSEREGNCHPNSINRALSSDPQL